MIVLKSQFTVYKFFALCCSKHYMFHTKRPLPLPLPPPQAYQLSYVAAGVIIMLFGTGSWCCTSPHLPCTTASTLPHRVYLAPLCLPCTTASTLHHCVYLAPLRLPCTTASTLHHCVYLAPLRLPCTTASTLHHCVYLSLQPQLYTIKSIS